MVFMFGGNDLHARKRPISKHRHGPLRAEYARVIRKFRAGKPEASCMIMSLTDHAKRVNGAIVSRPIVGRLAAAQRLVASREGCAFYDTFDAMGGVAPSSAGVKPSPRSPRPTCGTRRWPGNAASARCLYAH